jgi:8-oxo-dGTP diphosphatase
MKYFFLFFILCLPLLGENQTLPKEYRPPVLSTTAIIEVYDKEGKLDGIVLIERGKEPFGKALPGGKVEYGETVEHAVRREMKEETNLDLYELRQFHVYSEPSRDPRWHTVEVTHLAKAYGKPQAGDDAAKAFVVALDQIPWDELTFDHAQILKDYISYREGNKEIMMIKS